MDLSAFRSRPQALVCAFTVTSPSPPVAERQLRASQLDKAMILSPGQRADNGEAQATLGMSFGRLIFAARENSVIRLPEGDLDLLRVQYSLTFTWSSLRQPYFCLCTTDSAAEAQ